MAGFYSGLQLSLDRFGVGVGFYATSKRLFIFSKRELPLNKIVKGASSGDLIANSLTEDQNTAILDQLLQHRGVAVRKETISQLEMKRPPGIFRTGHLRITLISGDEMTKIVIGKPTEYELILRILWEFKPEALKVL